MKEKVTRYAELTNFIKKLEEEKDALNKELKQYMKEGGITSVSDDVFTVNYFVQERSTTLVDKMVQRLKDLGHEKAVKLVEVPNEETVQELIYNGKISAAQLEDCIQVKKIDVLKLVDRTLRTEKRKES